MKKLFAGLIMILLVTTACININIGTKTKETPDEEGETSTLEEEEIVEEEVVEEEVVEEEVDEETLAKRAEIMEEFYLTETELDDLKKMGLEERDEIFYYLDELNAMGPGPFQYNAELEDVSGGEASGYAGASYTDGYVLYASFDDLPRLEDGYFYEGWIVRNSPLSIVSTGAVKRVLGEFHNSFTSVDDLRDHDFYVLTLEPADGDPEPADHVLEGTLLQYK